MSVEIHSNTAQIINNTKLKSNTFLRLALDAVDKQAFPHTPKRVGNLRKDLKKSVVGTRGTIKWEKSYAIYQERGYGRGPIRNYTTPGTGPHFAERAVKAVVANPAAIMKQAGLI